MGITADPAPGPDPRPCCAICATNWLAAGHAGDRAATELAARLHPYVEGAFKQLFDGPTTTRPDGHLIVF